jgi:predicted transcriptional regulator
MVESKDKLDIHTWLDEYVNLLEKQGKLNETISELTDKYDPEGMCSDEDRKALIKDFFMKEENSEKLYSMYFDYLQDKTIIHLVDPEED